MAPIIAALVSFVPCSHAAAAEASEAPSLQQPVRIAPLAPLPPFIPLARRSLPAEAEPAESARPPRGMVFGQAFVPATRAGSVADDQLDSPRPPVRIAAFASALPVVIFVPVQRPSGPAESAEEAPRYPIRIAPLAPPPAFVPPRPPSTPQDVEDGAPVRTPRTAAIVAGVVPRACRRPFQEAESEEIQRPSRIAPLATQAVVTNTFVPPGRPQIAIESADGPLPISTRVAALVSAFVPSARAIAVAELADDPLRPRCRVAGFATPPAFVPPGRARSPQGPENDEGGARAPARIAVLFPVHRPPMLRQGPPEDPVVDRYRITKVAAFAPSRASQVPPRSIQIVAEEEPWALQRQGKVGPHGGPQIPTLRVPPRRQPPVWYLPDAEPPPPPTHVAPIAAIPGHISRIPRMHLKSSPARVLARSGESSEASMPSELIRGVARNGDPTDRDR